MLTPSVGHHGQRPASLCPSLVPWLHLVGPEVEGDDMSVDISVLLAPSRVVSAAAVRGVRLGPVSRWGRMEAAWRGCGLGAGGGSPAKVQASERGSESERANGVLSIGTSDFFRDEVMRGWGRGSLCS